MDTMNLKNNILKYLCCTLVILLSACEEETGRVVYPYSAPEISNFEVSVSEQMAAADSLFFSIDIKDNQTPLSTLEVSLSLGGNQIYSQSIRTKGMDASIKNYGIYVPFDAGLEDNTEATLTLVAINVEGSETKQEHQFRVMRPEIPETIYLHLDGQVIPMEQSQDNPYEYVTVSGTYPTQFAGKVSTSQTLEESKLIWGYAEDVNYAALISETGAGFTFDYQDWQIEQITFNTLTFKVGAIGTYEVYTINGVELEASAGYYKSAISFEQGQEVEVTGFVDIEGAYNRDFFEYNPSTGKLTFLRESGMWEVYYSSKYNYMWIVRMDDVAPEAFWLIGHGFISAPVWNDDYNTGGWDTEDVSRMAYAVKVADNTYQTTIYLNNTHEWASFEIEIYSDRQWNKTNGMELKEGALSGDMSGFTISQSNGITNTAEFVPGYYRLTFDTSAGVGNEKLSLTRLAD